MDELVVTEIGRTETGPDLFKSQLEKVAIAMHCSLKDARRSRQSLTGL